MSLTRTLHEGWRHFLEALHPDDRQKLVEMLREEYIEEAQDAVQFTRHAQRMYYPQFRERLLRIAAEEHTHVLWLREKILALGGNIPEVSFTPKVGKNSWECLLMDVEEEKRCCGDLLQRMHIAEHADPEIAEGLRRMREDEKLHREEIMDMLMKSDAYALPPERTVAMTYLDWLTTLPWALTTEDTLDTVHAQTVLDEDHFDLERVKERILEFLAVRQLRPESKGPILCLVGPPGTGKTSLGRSIARALGRKFVRISLGGVRDEAEIRGHRRTYVGALPGRIIQALRQARSRNPVFILDEIDKLGMDFRGDPSAALLEVLDPEQNATFVDHYLDVPFDLSAVMFITTANFLDPIPPALRDRMEVLELPGYTEEEKVAIAQRYLIPKQLQENGLQAEHLSFTPEAIREVINGYTREAGLRNLERTIARVCRKVARGRTEGRKETVEVTPKNLTDFLGPRQFFAEVAERAGIPGVATGLAWTPTGGEILFVEATRMRGKGGLTLTGHLGDVMKESAQAALSYVRSNALALGIAEDFFERTDIHIHVPAGAIAKDGPSAGVAMVVALTSLLTNTRTKPVTAMTGEITLRGKVLPVGGIKEKVLAAGRAGITTVILPHHNEKDLADVPQEIREKISFVFVEEIREAISAALEGEGGRQPFAVQEPPQEMRI